MAITEIDRNMKDRLNTHYKLSSDLALLSDKRLKTLLSKSGKEFEAGWGQSGDLNISGKRVFVKRIPLTDLEMANAYSTKNLYKIPTWYNYGIGSAGFGAFRELAAHVKTTNWVREGSCAAFPLLHHHRILTVQNDGDSDLPDLKNYIAYWNGSKTVERYMRDRKKSKHQLVLFIEAFTPLPEWIVKNPLKLTAMLPRATKCIDFLHQNGVIHFDGHEQNWLTDGKDVFLTDFGLLLDKEFELSKAEMQFFHKHRHYDYAQVVTAFGNELIEIYLHKHKKPFELIKKELKNSSNGSGSEMVAVIRAAMHLHESKQIKLPASLYGFIAKHQSVIYTKNEFFHTLARGKKTSELYPARKLLQLLRGSGVVV